MFIRGEANGASIELSEREGLEKRDGTEFYRVTLRENAFEASARVYAFDPNGNGLAIYFGGLSDEWMGWDGARTWSSLEGEFELSCEHDGIGNIATTATLQSNPTGYGWTGIIKFDVAAGDLKRIASDVASFFERP